MRLKGQCILNSGFLGGSGNRRLMFLFGPHPRDVNYIRVSKTIIIGNSTIEHINFIIVLRDKGV